MAKETRVQNPALSLQRVLALWGLDLAPEPEFCRLCTSGVRRNAAAQRSSWSLVGIQAWRLLLPCLPGLHLLPALGAPVVFPSWLSPGWLRDTALAGLGPEETRKLRKNPAAGVALGGPLGVAVDIGSFSAVT